MPANFSEEQVGVTENTGQWIVEFVAQNFAKIFVVRDLRTGAREAGFERFPPETPGGMQALFDTRDGSGKMRFVGIEEIGGTGSDQSGKTGGRLFVAENDNERIRQAL